MKARMIGMFRPLCALVSALLVAACSVSSVEEITDREPQEVSLSFSLSIGRTQTPQTKMTDGIVQNTGSFSFRGIEKVFVIPFSSLGGVPAGAFRFSENLLLPQQGLPGGEDAFATDAEGGDFAGLVWNNNAHLYKDVYVKQGTGSVLVYGEALEESVSIETDSIAFKRRNGSLVAHGLHRAQTTAGISFSLDPISDGAVDVDGLLTYLNSIAHASVTVQGKTVRFSDPTTYGNNSELAAAFDFTIFGHHPFAGSSLALDSYLTQLYHRIEAISGSTLVNAMVDRLLTLINNSDYVNHTGMGSTFALALRSAFPAPLGLPEGIVTLQWNGSEFWRPTPESGSCAVDIASFCYPPSLWYYVNSPLVASSEEGLEEQYDNSKTSWSDIAALYTDGSIVRSATVAAAVRDPLQYGVALLDIHMLHCSTDAVPDFYGDAVPVNGSYFPLTGVIVSDQRDLAFDFTPVSGDNHYIYDCEVMNGTTPKTWISSNGAGLSYGAVQVLAVQTEPAADLHMALEFQNNSGANFYGHDGDIILSGSRFYLFAELHFADAVNNSGQSLGSILVQDHYTRVNFRVNTLANAYATLPEMADPQLEIGVHAEVQWMLSTPETLPVK